MDFRRRINRVGRGRVPMARAVPAWRAAKDKGAPMNRLLLGATFGLATLVAYLPVAQAAETSSCLSAADLRTQAEIGSAKHGGKVLRLTGMEAAKFLDVLNNQIGDRTDYKGDMLIIGLYPDLGYALIAFIAKGCADQKNVVKLDPPSFIRAYSAPHLLPV